VGCGAPVENRLQMSSRTGWRIRQNWVSTVLLVMFAGILVWQLFLPGFIGIADSGDFPRVAGRLCLWPKATRVTFTYFQPDYVWSASRFWASPYHSSETVLGWLAIHLAGATHEGAHFDIRWLGAVHVVICLAGFAAFLAANRKHSKAAQVIIGAIPLLLLTDVCYAALLNSFYMDAAAFCGVVLMAGAAIWISAASAPRMGQLAIFFVAALLFVTSKTQHAIWFFFPAVFLAVSGFRLRLGGLKLASLGMAAMVACAGVYMIQSADQAYKGQAMFNLLFSRIGSEGAAAMPDLLTLGVQPDEARYLRTNSYTPGSPMRSPQFAEEFYNRTGFPKLLNWYWRHPAKTFRLVRKSLLWEEQIMRPNNLGNFRIEDGYGPRARTDAFCVWSDMRSGLFHLAPWYFPLWYVLFTGGCVMVAARRRSPASGRLAWLALGIAALGAAEFLVSNLADCLDMARHLLMFHACTDLTICFAVAWAVERAAFALRRKSDGFVPQSDWTDPAKRPAEIATRG